VLCLVTLVACSSGPSPEEIAKNEDISAITNIHRTIFQLDRELQQKREQFKNCATEAILSKNGISKEDKDRINATMKDYPKALESFISRAKAMTPPSMHNAAAKTDVESAINSANQLFLMQRKHFQAFVSVDLNGAAAINDQCEELEMEVAKHLTEAYGALGIPPERIDTTNGGVKPS